MKLITLTLLLLVPVTVQAAFWPLTPSNRTYSHQECMMCRFSVSLINYALRTQKGADQVYKFSNTFCALAQIESSQVCSSITKLFNQEIVKVLSNALFTPDQICGFLSNNTCGLYHNPLEDWEVNLNVSTTLNQEELEKMRLVNLERTKPQKPFRVIHISDTHIDLNYKEGSVNNCLEPLCCRPSSSVPKNESQILAGYWGSYGHCDVPLRTLESALKYINYTMQSNDDIAYIVWTGDIQPHDVWIQNKANTIATYDSVFPKIFEHLPNARIFPTLGNHEMIPADSFSPSNLLHIAKDDSPEWLYRKMDSYWSRWLPNETVETITKDGFYATTVKPGLKVISLNTNFCHSTNFWLYINSTDPGNQLQWLIHELQMSEIEHEQVHIIGHIPPGIDDCLKVWSKNYNKILRRFSKTVGGQFFGHTHYNEFEIFYDQDGTKDKANSDNGSKQESALNPISVGFIGPSITTFIDLNPSFRIYTIDPSQGYMPIDFETYYMNLTAANKGASAKEPEWVSVGNFTQLFTVSDTSPKSLHNLLTRLAGGPEISNADSISPNQSNQNVRPNSTEFYDFDDDDLFKLYEIYNSYSDNFSRAKFDNISKDEKRKYLCRFFTGQAHNLEACNQFIRGGHFREKRAVWIQSILGA